MKYLGVYIDKLLSWDYHVTEPSKKLSRANGILSKLCHYAPKETLISVYYINCEKFRCDKFRCDKFRVF